VTVDHLLRCLADRDVELYLDDDRLRFRAREGALTSELRTAIGVHREEIIERVRGQGALTIASGPCVKCDNRDWRDSPAQDGRIRTTCKKCGRFIGYRRDIRA
jgi:hypothetical protein